MHIISKWKVNVDVGYALEDATKYKNVVSSSIYVMISRPNLSYVVDLECRSVLAIWLHRRRLGW